MEAVIHVWVIDQSLPADAGTRLFKVHPHHNQEIIGQAFRLLAQEPDLLFADVALPAESGPELTERVRHEPRYAHIPVIFVTAMTDALTRLPGTVEEPMAVLEKPFRFEQVARTMRHLLRQ